MGKARNRSAKRPVSDGPTADEALRLVKELAETIRNLRIDEAIRFFSEAEHLPAIQEIIAEHDKRIAEEIGKITREAIFRNEEYDIDRVDHNPVLNACMNLARITRMKFDASDNRNPKPDEDLYAQVIRLHDENNVLFKKLGKCLKEINPEWNVKGKPYSEEYCKVLYGRAKKRRTEMDLWNTRKPFIICVDDTPKSQVRNPAR